MQTAVSIPPIYVLACVSYGVRGVLERVSLCVRRVAGQQQQIQALVACVMLGVTAKICCMCVGASMHVSQESVLGARWLNAS